MSPATYRLLADLILVSHFGIVLFILSGMVLPIIGAWRRWNWVRSPWYRLTHLVLLGLIVIQTWLSIECPLTTWEVRLRMAADENTQAYTTTFMQHWVGQLLFYNAPLWLFAVIYTVMICLCLASLILCPIRWRHQRVEPLTSTAAD
ncbi:MAG: DUF2784 domain-containing protein [Planctomycetes bacterium]|nr:DUF2784 domain-containing protein [Planctomycetota bacterium]NOG53666.1 DUF2784 domain-containing protein [Planctomycetota bacterium]